MTPLLSENPLPPPLPEALPANDPIPFPSRFVHLVYRYILGVFNCGELYQVDKTRSHEQLESRISFFAEVIRELPDRVARSILSMTLDQLYALTMKYPIYFVFFKTLINTRDRLPLHVLGPHRLHWQPISTIWIARRILLLSSSRSSACSAPR